MLRFEYDVSNKEIVVHGDKLNSVRYFISNDILNWCISYTKNYVYRELKRLVKSRESVFIHISDVTKNERCTKLLQKIERVYNTPNWLEEYLNVLSFDIESVSPHFGSRYFNGFYTKRNELIDTLRELKSGNPIYRKVNIEKQGSLALFGC